MQKQAYPDIEKAIDITRTIDDDLPPFPGDPKVHFDRSISGGASITTITLCSHSGTHIDAPSHYLSDGANVGDIPLDAINGVVKILDLSGIEREIEHGDLNIGNNKRLLIKTGYSLIDHFEPNYSALSIECAEHLANSGIICIGIDAPSIESFEGDGTVHRTLFSANIAILELLDLSNVKEGNYIMNALPLPIKDCDGAPLRALLYKYDNEVNE